MRYLGNNMMGLFCIKKFKKDEFVILNNIA